MRYPADHKPLTRHKVLDAAARGFRRQGIDRLSVAGLMQDAGLTHGGFYAHFSSKDELVVQAVAHAFTEAQSHLWQALDRAPVGQKTRAVVEHYLSRAHLRTPELGCPMAALGTELARQPEAVRRATAEGVHGLREVLTQAIAADGLRVPAELLVSTLVGGLAVARVATSAAQGERWRTQVLEGLAPWLSPTPTT